MGGGELPIPEPSPEDAGGLLGGGGGGGGMPVMASAEETKDALMEALKSVGVNEAAFTEFIQKQSSQTKKAALKDNLAAAIRRVTQKGDK